MGVGRRRNREREEMKQTRPMSRKEVVAHGVRIALMDYVSKLWSESGSELYVYENLFSFLSSYVNHNDRLGVLA